MHSKVIAPVVAGFVTLYGVSCHNANKRYLNIKIIMKYQENHETGGKNGNRINTKLSKHCFGQQLKIQCWDSRCLAINIQQFRNKYIQ